MIVKFASGWENNNATDGGKWDRSSGSWATSATYKFSGDYGVRANGTDSLLEKQFAVAGATDDVYAQAKLQIKTAPSSNTAIFQLNNTYQADPTLGICWVTLTTDRKLRLYDSAGVQVGSESAARFPMPL